MKVTIIINSLNVGGAEVMLLKLLEQLSSKIEFKVISLTNIGPVGYRIQDLGISVSSLGMPKGAINLPSFSRLLKLLAEDKPDIVHTWLYHADLIGGLAARLAGVPVVIWNIRHSNFSGETKKTTKLVALICAYLSRVLPNYIQCCSVKARDIHVKLGYLSNKIAVIPNGFDLSSYRPDMTSKVSVKKELNIDLNNPLVGLIARFNPQKNHIGFIQAAKKLHQDKPHVHFLLAGRGVDQTNSQIVAAIHEANIENVTHLLGERDDIPRLMASLDVLVSASSYGEAFPNVLGEAMACGVPCVATDVGDSAYIIGDTGKLVLSGNMHALADALDELLTLPENERLQLGKHARVRVAQNFEISKVAEIYRTFYENSIFT
jgi:glycosyltransferase involved in cell wall biosynthesis